MIKTLPWRALALRLRRFPPCLALLRFWYFIGLRSLLFVIRRVEKKTGLKAVRSVYLTGGGGQNDLVHGTIDLDFFVVLEVLGAEQEMEFLKVFWPLYWQMKRVFPFYGEMLMGDENEIANWFDSSTLRAYEAKFSWRHLTGEKILEFYYRAIFPNNDEIFHEAIVAYWEVLRAFFQIDFKPMSESKNFSALSCLKHRDAAKSALDLFRIHRSLSADSDQRQILWSGSRREGLSDLQAADGSDLTDFIPILFLRKTNLNKTEIHKLFVRLLYQALVVMHEISEQTKPAAMPEEDDSWSLNYHGNETEKDFHGYSVRELFAERLLFRHSPQLERMILSKQTGQMYAIFSQLPSLEEFETWLTDVQTAKMGVDSLFVCMPLTSSIFYIFLSKHSCGLRFFLPMPIRN